MSLPQGTGEAWLSSFARGLGEDAELFGCPLLGGDTDRTPGPISVSVMAFGAVPHGTMVRRAGAKPGHRVVVTGTIGDAALGLALRRDPTAAQRWGLAGDQQDHLKSRYLVPQPRNAIAEILRAHAAAAMDVSDGLAGDLAKLCRASGVAAEIACADVPLSDAARAALARDPALIETVTLGATTEIWRPCRLTRSWLCASKRRPWALRSRDQATWWPGEALRRHGWQATDAGTPSFSHF